MFLERREKRVSKNFKEYVNSQFNCNSNYQIILNKVKGSGSMKKRRVLNIAAVLLVILLLGAMAPGIYASIKWNIEYKEYQNRKVDYGLGSINTAVDEYGANIDMEYVYQDSIGVKVDSLIVTNDYFKMGIDFKLPEETTINTDTFIYNFAVYDENNNIYGVFERLKIGEKINHQYGKKLYKELGVKYDKNDISAVEYQDSCQGASVTSSEKGHIIAESSMTSGKGFPRSKKIYIRIFDVGYSLYNFDEVNRKMLAAENVTLSDAEWILEVEVPEEFYDRETIELKVNEKIPEFELTKAEVTETGTQIKVKLEGMMDIILAGREQSAEEFDNAVHNAIHIEDEKGNVYYNFGLATTGNQEEVKMTFDISKKDISQQVYYLCLNIKGKYYRVKLEIETK